MQMIEDIALSEKGFPSLFIYHGKGDHVVPVEGTEKFVAKVKKYMPQAKLVMKIEDGDHGFDFPLRYEVDGGPGWLREGLELVTHEWIGV